MPANLPYFPSRNADIAPWLLNFSTLLTAAPTDYGLTAGNAVTVAAQNTAWQAAYTAATNPVTRTSVTVAALQSATFTMRAIVLPFATLIAGNPAVLDADKIAIGVTVRITTRTPIPPPADAPGFDLVRVTPLSARYRYYDLATPTSKKKPYGAVSIEV